MNFANLKRDLGMKPTDDVLLTIKTWSPEEQVRGHKIIYDFEYEARENLIVQEGCKSLMQWLERHGIKKAIHSRNSLENIEYFVRYVGHDFHHLVGREIEPVKPHPAGCHEIKGRFEMQGEKILPTEIIFVGDSKDDMECSRNFGSISCLLKNQHNEKYSNLADFTINSLIELEQILDSNFSINDNNNKLSTTSES
eukprot:gene11219-13744_t